MNDQHFHRIFQKNPLPGLLVLADVPAFTIVDANDAYCEATGSTISDLVGNSLFVAFPGNPHLLDEDGVVNLRNSLTSVATQGKSHTMPLQRYDIPNRHTGEWIEKYWEPENIPILDDDGNVSHILHTVKDATTRVVAEQHKERIESRYRSMMDQAVSAWFVTLPENAVIVEANKAACELFGYSEEEFRAAGCARIMEWNDPVLQRQLAERLIKGQVKGELTALKKNGERFPAEYFSTIIRDENGRRIASTIMNDISERKRSEQEISLLINNTEESFVLLDNDLVIRSFNRQFFHLYQQYFGLEVKKDEPFISYAGPEEKAEVMDICYKVLKGQSMYREVIVPAPAYREKIYAFRYKPALDDNDNPIGVFISATDITKTKAFERDLLESKQAIQKILDQSQDIICTIDMQTIFVNVSAAAEKIWGYPVTEISGSSFMRYVHPDDLERTRAVAKEIMAGVNQTNFENRYVCQNGDIVTMTWSARWDENERIIYAIGRDATELKKAARQLESSEQRFKSLVQDGADLIAILDLQGNYSYVSPTSISVLGISPEEFIGRSAFEFIHDDDRDRVFAGLQRLATEKMVNIEPFRFKHSNGSWRWIETAITNLLDEPAIMGIVANSRDVTARISIDEAIRIQHKHYTDVFMKAPAFICILQGAEHVFQMTNPHYEELVGRTDLIGKAVRQALPEVEGQGFFELLDTVFSTGEPFIGNELPIILNHAEHGRRTRYVDFSYQAYRNISNEIEGIFVFGTDVTYQVEARKALYESNERYKYVTNATSDAIWDWDLVNSTLFGGEGYELLFGYRKHEMPTDIGSRLGRIHREDIERVLNGIHRTINGADMRWTDKYRYLKKDGTYAFVLDRGFVIRNNEGKAIRMVGAMQDITRQRNEEIRNNLVADARLLFSREPSLAGSLEQILRSLMAFGRFDLAEFWIVGQDRRTIDLTAKVVSDKSLEPFYSATADMKSFTAGEGLPGKVWRSKSIQHWASPADRQDFRRRQGAHVVGLKTVAGIPLIFNDAVIGVLVVAHVNAEGKTPAIQPLLALGFSDHLAAEIKRKQLEEELTQIFNAAPDIICIAGADGYFKKINPAGCEMLEYSEEELLSRPIRSFVHPEDRKPIEEKNMVAPGNHGSGYHESRLITKSGKSKWFGWSHSSGSDSRVYYVLGKDITEKKELEFLVERSSKMARIGSWELDLSEDRSNSLYWSPMTREILEVSTEFRPTLSAGLKFFDGESKARIRNAITNLIRTGTEFDLELLVTTARENPQWVRCIGQSERLDGKCIKIFGSFQDIHARKVAELSLIETNNKVLSTLESIQDGFYALDRNWVITYWNQEAERMLQTRREDVIGKNFWTVFPEAQRLKFHREYNTALNKNTPVRFEEFFAPRWYDTSAFPSENGLTVYFRDITERKNTEEKLQEANHELIRHARDLASSNAELEQFAYAASHDLQEPLRMVTSFLTQLEKNYQGQLDDRAKQYIYFAVDGAKRMRQIILDLLEYSRAGRIRTENEWIDLNELIREILLLHKTQLDETDSRVSVGSLPRIYGPKAPVRQVFQNLVSNALKYHARKAQPLIRIDALEENDSWVFSVADNGIGIHPDYHAKIFVIFQRLHTRDDYPGIGMGLPICKKIVENLGGKIWLESREGDGSIFYIRIPKHELT